MKTIPCLLITAMLGGTAFAEEAKRERPERPIHAAALKKFDKDGDGKLSEDEKAEMRRVMGERRDARQQEILKRFDADGDGTLSEDERKLVRETIHKEMLAKYDADGDGKLDQTERAAMMEGEGFNPMRFHPQRGVRGGRMGQKRERGPLGEGRPRQERRQDPGPQE